MRGLRCWISVAAIGMLLSCQDGVTPSGPSAVPGQESLTSGQTAGVTTHRASRENCTTLIAGFAATMDFLDATLHYKIDNSRHPSKKVFLKIWWDSQGTAGEPKATTRITIGKGRLFAGTVFHTYPDPSTAPILGPKPNVSTKALIKAKAYIKHGGASCTRIVPVIIWSEFAPEPPPGDPPPRPGPGPVPW